MKGGFVTLFEMVTFFNQVSNAFVGLKVMVKIFSNEINNSQKILGHYGEVHLKATASVYGVKVFGKLDSC
jgi:hypothetical protein